MAYLIPIIETLAKRIIPRIRALILLPTKDLVIQVKRECDHFVKGTGLKVLTLSGQSSFSHEQGCLLGEFGECLVDILIATPGRLVDHLQYTQGFNVTHLRYLVLDEADRLMNQSYSEWLPELLHHISATPQPQNSTEIIPVPPVSRPFQKLLFSGIVFHCASFSHAHTES